MVHLLGVQGDLGPAGKEAPLHSSPFMPAGMDKHGATLATALIRPSAQVHGTRPGRGPDEAIWLPLKN
jgi:hypothetical protein